MQMQMDTRRWAGTKGSQQGRGHRNKAGRTSGCSNFPRPKPNETHANLPNAGLKGVGCHDEQGVDPRGSWLPLVGHEAGVLGQATRSSRIHPETGFCFYPRTSHVGGPTCQNRGRQRAGADETGNLANTMKLWADSIVKRCERSLRPIAAC